MESSKSLFAVIRRYGSPYDPQKPLEAQPEWEAHRFFMNTLGAEGLARLAGPLEGNFRLRAFSPHARAKKLARAAECLVYSLTPSEVLAENHPKNRGFVGILRGQKYLRRRFSRRSPVGEWSRGARSMPRVERTAAPVAQPIGVAASPEIAL